MIALTSVDSLIEQKESGKAKKQRLAILNYLRLIPSVGLSRNDIARIFGFPIQSVCGRIGELKAEGLVVEDAPRLDPFTERKVKPVRAAPDLFTMKH
ncbi:TPA: MarR family transcriptional regulator [Burkholderia contaminans]|uniref:MarR family transcriptional regulator n=1 Tax=Burkholderia contaminans TaxID=488447 RepID=UPI000D000095|nr:MarR family transcriptional regulator [Burkholderia contaminans]HDR9065515.1 MarR family transcriptional regulator [Burkholderia vietnamiensis]MBM6427954.1 MarR family transcriptional regulator [Burkholderia contaminans]MCA7876785.1 MarR family transcriptional regulator [Burkholderia contaminans]MDN8024192.1 MarR family transcriptional regulator [Burkholderia contaminans]PRG12192.1 hypothetical protein C6Q17_14130 [Burkholderia contaminans]